MEKKTIEVLWTGGYDSTYMVTRLSRRPVRIQPVYMQFKRRSEALELKAMSKITALLKKHPATKAEFLETRIMPWGSIAEDPEVKSAYDKLVETHFIGYQYNRLAPYAKEHPGMEIGIYGRAIAIIKDFGQLNRFETEEEGQFYALDPEKSDDIILKLFGYYHFPIAGTKKEETTLTILIHKNGVK